MIIWLQACVRTVIEGLLSSGNLREGVQIDPYVDDVMIHVKAHIDDAKDRVDHAVPLVLAGFEKAGFPVNRAKDISSDQEEPAKTLGIFWSGSKEDVLRCKYLAETPPPTRRQLVSCVNSVYDPLGFVLGHVTYGRALGRCAKDY